MPTTRHSATPDPAAPELVITRTFDAPRDIVFQAFTTAEALAQWWGPKGFFIDVAAFEFRPGGIFHYRMEHPTGNEMWGRFTYREIVPPDRLVWVNSFSDPGGNIVKGPFFDHWPLGILNTLTLEEQDGKTVLTLHSTPINATELEREAFVANLDSMRMGFGGTWDKLDDYLARETTRA